MNTPRPLNAWNDERPLPADARAAISSGTYYTDILYNDILQYTLRYYSTNGLINSTICAILNDMAHYDGILLSQESRPLPYPTVSASRFSQSAMHTHPDTVVRCNRDLHDLQKAISIIPEDHLAKGKLEKVLSYWTSANSLKLLDRFISQGHCPLRDDPNHKTFYNNLPSDHHVSYTPDWTLRHDFYLRRNLVRLLHYPGLIRFILFEDGQSLLDPKLPQKFTYVYGSGRMLLQLEVQKICKTINPLGVETDNYEKRHLVEESYAYHLDFISQARRKILSVLEEIAKIAFEPPRSLGSRFFNRPQPALTREEILRTNLEYSEITLVNRMIEKYDELMVNLPLERLLIDLLDKEDTFERKLTVEHIEDRLVNKQIALLDDEFAVNHPHTLRGVYDWANEYKEKGFEDTEIYLYKILGDIALTNRQRRNFRLIRDWTGGRPWKQIFQLYDTSTSETAWLKGAIDKFSEHLAFSINPSESQDQIEPSSFVNIGRKLFAFLPLDFTNMVKSYTEANKPIPFCSICRQEFHASNDYSGTIVELHCTDSHPFHLECIFDYWDSPGRYKQQCPDCGQSPELTYQRVGLKPVTSDEDFVFNVFGYRRGDNPKRPNFLADFDVPEIPPVNEPSRYWKLENELLANVVNSPLGWRNIRIEADGYERISRQDLNHPAHQVARRLGSRWRAANPGMWEDARVRARGVWEAKASRYLPAEELAFLRAARRKRDRERRRRVGMQGLPGMFP